MNMERTINISSNNISQIVENFSDRKTRCNFYTELYKVYETFRLDNSIESFTKIGDIFNGVSEDSLHDVYHFYIRLRTNISNEDWLVLLKYLVEEESKIKFTRLEFKNEWTFQNKDLYLVLGNYPHYLKDYQIEKIKKFEIEMLLRTLSYILFVENKSK